MIKQQHDAGMPTEQDQALADTLMDDLKKLKDNAFCIDKSISTARLYNDKKTEYALVKSQVILLKLAQHLENPIFDLKNLKLDIFCALNSPNS